MEVYIEYVIADNLIVDCLLLKLALSYTKTPRVWFRVALSAMIGTVVATIMPLIKMDAAIKFAMKVALAFIMVAVAARFRTPRHYILALNLFVMFTFIFGGAVYGFMYFIGVDYSFFYGTYDGAIPLGLIVLATLGMYKLLKKMFVVLFEKKIIYPFIRRCTLVSKGNTLTVSGLIDSGNHLIFKNDCSVCVAGKKLARRLIMGGFLEGNMCGYMVFSTVCGKARLKIFEIDKMLIYSRSGENIIDKPKIGIGDGVFPESDDYDLILGAEYACVGDKIAA